MGGSVVGDVFITSLIRVAMLVAMAVPGFLLRKTKMVGDSAVSTLVVVLLYVGQPFLSISSLIGCEYNPEMLINMAIVLLSGFVFHIALYFLFKPMFIRKTPDDRKKILLAAALFGNTGFMGIPVIKALFPGVSEMLVYTVVFNISCNIIFWTLSAYIISGDKKAISIKRAIINPPTIALVVALPIFFFNVQLPAEIGDFITSFGDLVSPIAMLILGMRLADINLKSLFVSSELYICAFVRLIVFPLIVFIVLFLINLVYKMSYYVIAVQFIVYAMPTANTVLSFAELYKKDGTVAAQSAMLSTILSIVTIPVMMMLLEVFKMM